MDKPSSPFDNLVARGDLQRQLADSLTRRLTLVVAPAGYGKTTLIDQLLQAMPATLPRVYYPLDEADNDPTHLLAGLQAALRARLPAGDSLPEVDESQASLSFPLSILFRQAAELTHSDWLLVFDDYHCISNPGVHQALDALLNLPNWPVHLVVASRTPPVLAAAARLRVGGNLVELDERDLRFTPDEILRLFAAEGLHLDDLQLSRVAERTEGWPAALRLVCQASRRVSVAGLQGLLERMGHENGMFDYLAGQVLNRQPETLRRFLRRTAILPYLSASLCDAFLNSADAAAILGTLLRDHLFITPLTEGAEPIFRYHGLFAEFLRRCLDQEEGSQAVRALHRRAAECFMQRRLGEPASQIAASSQAIPHWIAAGEPEAAAGAIEALAELLDRSQLYTLEKWFEALPQAVIDGRPRLLIAMGLLRERECRWSEALAAFERARQVWSAQGAGAPLLSQVWIHQAWVYHRQGMYERVAELCQRALQALAISPTLPQNSAPPQFTHERAEVFLLQGASEYETGHFEASLQADEQALRLFRETGDRVGETSALSHLAYVYGNQGRLAEYIQTERTTLQIYDELGSFRAASSLAGLADAYRQTGQYDLAREMLDRLLRMVDANPDPLNRGYALFLLGHWQRERGERAEARSSYEEARSLGEKLHEPTLLGEPRRGLALLALDEGDLGEARRQAESALEQMRAIGHRALEGQALIALGLVLEEVGELRQSETCFQDAWQLFIALGDAFAQANITLYLADLYRRDGRDPLAQDLFSQSLALSRRYGYDSFFTERERDRTLPLLIDALRSPTPAETASDVTRLLGSIGPDALQPLLDLLETEPASLDCQERIIRVLGKIGDERAIPALDRLSRLRPVKEACQAALVQIAARPAPILHIYALGGFQVLRGRTPIPSSDWQQRRKTRLLLLYLLAHCPRRISRDELLETLWTDLPPDSSNLALNTTFSDLRKLLEPYLGKGMPSRYLVREGDCFWFNPASQAWYDVHRFEAAVQAGAPSLRAAQELYRGDFLPEEPYLDWVVRERERLRSLFLNLLVEELDRQMRQGAWHAALDLARRILEQEPWLEEVWRAQMTCLAMQGRRSEAIQVYLAGERSLRQELGVEPSAETRAAYAQLKA
jgi:LuxR family transcriptional regulator, maltose regulon positive regulatory protein